MCHCRLHRVGCHAYVTLPGMCQLGLAALKIITKFLLCYADQMRHLRDATSIPNRCCKIGKWRVEVCGWSCIELTSFIQRLSRRRRISADNQLFLDNTILRCQDSSLTTRLESEKLFSADQCVFCCTVVLVQLSERLVFAMEKPTFIPMSLKAMTIPVLTLNLAQLMTLASRPTPMSHLAKISPSRFCSSEWVKFTLNFFQVYFSARERIGRFSRSLRKKRCVYNKL